MKMQANNNKGIINHIAGNSIKYSRMRNVFTILTIALSVSLLMVMGLFTLGYEKANERKVEKVQHVIYQNLNDEQIAKLEKIDDITFLTYSKSGMGIEYKNKFIQPYYTDMTPVKGDISDMEFNKPAKGEFPAKKDEIIVSPEFLKMFGKDAIVGTEITTPFLDNVKETFVVSGIYNIEYKSDILSMGMSTEYAETGSQLKDLPYNGIVRIFGAEKMTQDQFKETIYKIGADCGIDRKNINDNSNFVDTLPGGTTETIEKLICIGIGICILLVSVLVIYSIFYISVVGRIRQFGQFRTVGMTRKQLKKLITREGLLLSVIGIPVGLIIGCVLGYALQPEGWDWINTLLLAVVVSAACLITVMLSIKKPGKLASKVTPIEAMKYSGYEVEKTKKSTKNLQRKLTPFSLARISTNRNRKRTLMTIISLGVGGILFMTATTFITSTSLIDYSRQSDFKNGEFMITISENARNTATNGLTDIQLDNPLNEDMIMQIKGIEGVKKVYQYDQFAVKWEAHGEAEDDYVASFKDGEITNDMVEEGSVDYDTLVDNDGIVISTNDTVNEVFGWKYKVGDTIKFTFYDGKGTNEREFKVGAIINSDIGYDNLVAGWFFLPEETYYDMTGDINTNDTIVISTDENKTDQVEKSLSTMLQEEPQLSMETLRERMEYDKNSFGLLFGVILGLSIFIICFSLINLINTLITNILSRKREFATIQSIGMTHDQLKKMIISEGLILAVGNMILTLILGVIVGVAGVNFMNSMGAMYMNYSFPTLYFIGYVIVIIGIPVIISIVSINIFKKQSLVDRLGTVD